MYFEHFNSSFFCDFSPARSQSDTGEDGPMWTCPYCTYHNAANRDICEICVLPR